MSIFILSFTHLSTRLIGIDRTVRIYQRLGGMIGRKTDLDAQTIAARALRGLDLLPLRVECLDQAIAVWFALNRRGHCASLKIGMRLSPLSGHAWVTCGDDIYVSTPGLEDFTVVAAYESFAAT